MAKKIIIELTKNEYEALSLIIENGWGDGDLQGFSQTATQNRALKKFFDASTKSIKLSKTNDKNRK